MLDRFEIRDERGVVTASSGTVAAIAATWALLFVFLLWLGLLGYRRRNWRWAAVCRSVSNVGGIGFLAFTGLVALAKDLDGLPLAFVGATTAIGGSMTFAALLSFLLIRRTEDTSS